MTKRRSNGTFAKGHSGNPLGRGYRKALAASEAGLSKQQVSDLRTLNVAELLQFVRGEVKVKAMSPFQKRLQEWERADPKSFWTAAERVCFSRPPIDAPIESETAPSASRTYVDTLEQLRKAIVAAGKGKRPPAAPDNGKIILPQPNEE